MPHFVICYFSLVMRASLRRARSVVPRLGGAQFQVWNDSFNLDRAGAPWLPTATEQHGVDAICLWNRTPLEIP